MKKGIFTKATSVLLLLIMMAVLSSCRSGEALQVIEAETEPVSAYAVYTADGDILYLSQIEAIGRTITGKHKIKAGDRTIVNPVGIIQNPPSASITDIYGMVLDSLDRDNDVLIIYIDGLGYDLYRRAAEEGYIPYLAALDCGVKANTVYPSITDVTFASMVTGRTPRYTGIHNRDKKPLPIPTVFDAATERGKKSLLIEGDMNIIIDEVETVLNIDEDGDSTIDDEIYEYAMKAVKSPIQLLLLHFHSYDDIGHKHGPDSREALEQLKVLDSYIKDIMQEHIGDVIITSDHGMHRTESGGMHGSFCSEDMFIPLITKKLQ